MFFFKLVLIKSYDAERLRQWAYANRAFKTGLRVLNNSVYEHMASGENDFGLHVIK